MKKLLVIILALTVAAGAAAQTSLQEIADNPRKAGGVYLAYPEITAVQTPAPKGYKPFHISHYGRHGSRYLISDNDYLRVARALHKADSVGALTAEGKRVMQSIDRILPVVDKRGGDLTPIGVRQHRGIAERMYRNFPEVFKGETPVDARSTTVPRCIMSMDAFCERLKELNPSLKTTRQASGKYMDTLNYHSQESMKYTSGDWKIRYRKFEDAHTNPERLIGSLFNNTEYVANNIVPSDLMWGLYWIAVGMQDIESDEDLLNIFTPQELFDLWQCVNYRFYVCDGNYPGNGGLLVDNAKRLLTNIISTADTVINSKTPSVALRFGHDGNLIPLTALLQLDGCWQQEEDPDKFYLSFNDFKIAPMAGNVQIIFYRNTKHPQNVLVKFLHNEMETAIPIATDIFPYYKWEDVREFYMQKLRK